MAKAAWTYGVDLGGTKIDIGLVDAEGKVQRREIIKTQVTEGPEAILKDIKEAAQRLRNGISYDVQAVGIGMAGQIEKGNGLVHFAPNLGWKEFPLGDEMSKALKLPTFVTNDVRAATYGEWLYGAGKGCDDLLCVFVGTGIGGGVVSGGRMLIGDSNTAGEVGHMTIDLKGPSCTCGNRGCFEALAGGWAIARRAREVANMDRSGGLPLVEMAGGKIDDITTKHLFAAYRNGLPMAQKIVDEVKEALVAGLAGLVNAFNPARLLLGGGVLLGNRELLPEIKKGVTLRALKAASVHLKIIEVQLIQDASVIGAAAFAQKSLDKEKI